MSNLFSKSTIQYTLVFMLIGWTLTLHAQTIAFTNYTTKEGLVSNTIYDIATDNYGFLWVATNYGISKFDGATFKNFTKRDGLPDNEILGFYNDSRGRMWLKSYNGLLAYIQDGMIHNAANTPFLRSLNLGSGISMIAEDKEGNVYFSTFEMRLTQINVENVAKDISHNFRSFKVLEDIEKNIYLIIRQSSGGHFVDLKNFQRVNFDTIPFGKIGYDEIGQVDHSIKSKLTNKRYNIQLDSTSRQFVTFHQGTYWKYSKNHPLTKCILKDKQLIDQIEISEIQANRTLIDKEDNLWFCSLENGLFKFNPQIKQQLSTDKITKKDKLTCMFKSKDHLYIGGAKGYIYSTSGDKLKTVVVPSKPLKEPNSDYTYEVKKIEQVSSGEIYVGTDYGIIEYDSNFAMKAIRAFSLKAFTIDEDDIYISHCCATVKMNRHDFSSAEQITFTKTYNNFVTNDKSLWIGSNEGLILLKNGNPEKSKDIILSESTSISVSNINALSNENVLVGTYGNGLFIVDKNGHKLNEITYDSGLPSDFINHIFIDQDDYVWLSSNNGISKLKIDGAAVSSIENYTKDIGFFSNIILQSKVENQSLFALSPEGLVEIDLTKLNNNSPSSPIAFLDHILINGQATIKDKLSNLEYFENDIEFQYAAASMNHAENLIFNYRLKGASPEWKRTKDKKIQYASLDPGKYQFEVFAELPNDFEKQKHVIKSIPFTIHPVWYKSYWFILSALFLGLGLIYFWVFSRFQAERKKHFAEMELAKLNQRALLTEMNPHFINNCLSSIQNFILIGDKREASNYLTKFAKLIRMILHYTKSEKISLAQEIEYLILYLELEQLRFSHKFEFNINLQVEESEQRKIHLPTMLIQPLLENAITHGFDFSNKDPKSIQVNISKSANYLKCFVLDNGIGLTQSSKKKKMHSSGIALKNIKSRIQFIKKEFPNTNFDIKELKDESKSTKGTSVEIIIPITINQIK